MNLRYRFILRHHRHFKFVSVLVLVSITVHNGCGSVTILLFLNFDFGTINVSNCATSYYIGANIFPYCCR